MTWSPKSRIEAQDDNEDSTGYLVGDCICVTRNWMLGEVEWSHTRYGEVRAGGVGRTPRHIYRCPELRDRIELATSR